MRSTKTYLFIFFQGFESWVLSDYTASGQGELSVQRGQQVEVLEPASGSTSTAMVVVRLFGQKEEGMIPLTCLKQPAGGLKYRNLDGKITSVFFVSILICTCSIITTYKETKNSVRYICYWSILEVDY